RPGNPGCRRSGIRSRRPPAAHAGLRLDHRVPGMAAAAGRLPRHAAAPAGRARHRPGAAGGGRVERSVSGWTEWPAPAKLNLFLRITGRRPDGYHELQTVFRILDWGDTIRLRVREDGQVVRHGASAPGVTEADDLTVRAAKLLQSHANCAFGADISVEKRVPSGGGFGGGSSDAATVLRALDRLWRLDLPEDEIAALGLRLGADVPVFVHGRTAWAEGVGEKLVALDLPPAWYVLADPGVHVPTAALFAAPDLTRTAAPAKIADFTA